MITLQRFQTLAQNWHFHILSDWTPLPKADVWGDRLLLFFFVCFSFLFSFCCWYLLAIRNAMYKPHLKCSLIGASKPFSNYDPFWSHISEITYLKNNFLQIKIPKLIQELSNKTYFVNVLKPWDHQKSNSHQIFIQFHNADVTFHEF